MRKLFTLTTRTLLCLLFFSLYLGNHQTAKAQDVVHPTFETTGVYHGTIGPLRDIPPIKDMKKYEEDRAKIRERIKEIEKERNGGMKYKNYSDIENAKPGSLDPLLQSNQKSIKVAPVIDYNWAGQNSTSYPLDCNGEVGPNHYMQTINCTYTIYNKTGTLLAGPTNMNTLFSGVTGATYNDGDPIILYDEFADRWFAAEFSISGSNNYMLIAVSTSNDPTGTWNRWSFDVDDMPDYMKFGIWRDGYYMADNNSGMKDIYVFQRDQMMTSGTSPKMVGFANPNRPNSGFHCIMPCDNDFAQAASGAPGLFITINDNAWGGSDQLWIYELAVDWTTTSNSTFSRVQTLSVTSFDSNFGSTWDNIAQQGTTQKLDAINTILMYRAQYINWGTSQTIVCQHSVDVDGTDHAGIRWYELQKTTGTWSIRQSGTYAPDAHSRWCGGIAMNQNHEIGLAYSISSSSLYPGIRFTGQSATQNAAATGTFDIDETVIKAGVASQTSYNRWGDYTALSVDPTDKTTFWFSTQYGKTSTQKGTQVTAFHFPNTTTTDPVANFSADNTSVLPGTTVNFTDLTINNPTSWVWSFPGGTPSSSTLQNPSVVYNTIGTYDVTLTATNATGSDVETKTGYIIVANATYCTADGQTQDEYISNVTAGSINNNSSWIAYNYYSSLSTTVTPGSTLNVSVNLGTVYVDDIINVWVDWNQDMDFADSGESGTPFTVTSSSTLPCTFAIPVPSNATAGTTRMRVRVQYQGTADPCGSQQYGEVEDYNIVVQTGPVAPVAAFVASATNVTPGTTVNFTDQSSGTPTSWLWSFPGGSPTSSTLQNPSVVYNTIGTYDVTLTATNATGSDAEAKTGYIVVANAPSGFSMDFEACTDFSLDFTPWTVNDVDGVVPYGSNTYNFTNEGVAQAFIAFNPTNTTPTASGDAALQPHGGVRFGACFSATTPPNNDWLISNQLQLGTNSSLTCWVKSYVSTYGLERYKIGVSTTTNDPASFTILTSGSYEEAPTTWTQKTIDLSAYNNQNVYIGFNCVSNDAFVFMIDDIQINTTTSVNNNDISTINVYPNPANDYLVVDFGTINKENVTIKVVDVTGKSMFSKQPLANGNFMRYDLSNLSSGVYFVQISTPNQTEIRKITVAK